MYLNPSSVKRRRRPKDPQRSHRNDRQEKQKTKPDIYCIMPLKCSSLSPNACFSVFFLGRLLLQWNWYQAGLVGVAFLQRVNQERKVQKKNKKNRQKQGRELTKIIIRNTLTRARSTANWNNSINLHCKYKYDWIVIKENVGRLVNECATMKSV